MSVGHIQVTSQVTGVAPAGPCGEDDCGIRDILDRIGDKWTVLSCPRESGVSVSCNGRFPGSHIGC
jgi:hypothetical protein